MSLSRATLIGEIVRQPEQRVTSNNTEICKLIVRTSGNLELSLTCWAEMASKVGELSIGDVVFASGNLITNTYKSADGVNRKDFELVVRDIAKLSGLPINLNPVHITNRSADRQSGSSRSSGQPSPSRSTNMSGGEDSSYEDISSVFDYSEIPF